MLIKRLFLLVALSVVFPMSTAQAWDWDPPSNCERSARTMLRACRYDVKDDLYETFASCQHIADQGARWSCYMVAFGAKAEDSEECGDVYEARVDACDILDEDRYDPDPLVGGGFVNFEEEEPPIPNPYVSVEPGHTYVLRAGEEEEELVIVYVTDGFREVQGVTCRIVVDIVLEVEESEDVAGEFEYEVVEAMGAG